MYRIGLLFTLQMLLLKQFLLRNSTLLKVERSVLDRFLKRSKSSLNTFLEQKLQRNLVLVNDLFKSKGSVANCMTQRASVPTGCASEQFLHCSRTLILVHTVLEEHLKRSKTYPVECEYSLINWIYSQNLVKIAFIILKQENT